MRTTIVRNIAFLPSKGLNERRATKHVYSHSETKTFPPRSAEDKPSTGIAHYFRCTETGELRQWGFDATSAHDAIDNGGN